MSHKILLVDDATEVRETLAKLLGQKYDVVTAKNAEDGLLVCQQDGPFAVVVSDYDMPGRKGTEFLAQVSATWPETVGVMLTGLADLDVAVRALHQGRVFRFLSKPASFDVLSGAIDEALGKHEQIVSDRLFAEELIFSKETLANFTAVLEQRINRQTAALTRMHDFAVDLNAASSLVEIAQLAARASYEILGGRGVHVQIWDGGSHELGVEAAVGPEMSAAIHEEHLATPEGRLGQIAIDGIDRDGHRLSEADLRLLSSLASSTAVAAHNEFRRRERDEAQHATILALARLSEQRDNETGKHIERVSSYCKLAAEALRDDGKHLDVITPLWISDLVRSAPLHDIGKVGIPDSILLKPGKLTPEEWEIMKTHAEIGAVTLDSVIQENGHQGFLTMGRDIAWCHHERWNGEGYPRGLRGADIPLAARILALADVYDALTTVRPYKQAWTHEAAIEWIEGHAGSQFDPDVVAAFLRRSEDARAICERLADNESDFAGLTDHSARAG